MRLSRVLTKAGQQTRINPAHPRPAVPGLACRSAIPRPATIQPECGRESPVSLHEKGTTMKIFRLTAAALAVGGLLGFGATQVAATPGAQAHQPVVSTPSPDHQANVTSLSGGAPFDRHLYSPYSSASLTGYFFDGGSIGFDDSGSSVSY
jgi:hypothetical protein